MREAGRLTKAEFNEFESHLVTDYLSALPMETYAEMRKDGSYAELEALAGHDANRNGHDVGRDREALNKRITGEALDEALASGKVDSKMYAEEHKKLGSFDDDRVRRINDASDNNDGEAVAMDIFFERLLPPGDREPEPAAPAEDRIKSADED